MTGYLGTGKYHSFSYNRGFSGQFSQFTTLDPTKKATAITLSGGNLTATGANPAAPGGVLSTNGLAQSGKHAFQCTIGANPGSAGAESTVIALTSWSLTSTPGSDTATIRITHSTGNVQLNSVIIGTGAAGQTAGTVVDVALDLTAKLMWYRLNGGNWNNSATAHPDTGAGGFSIAALATGSVFAGCYMLSAITAAMTFNFEAASPATGYQPWDI